MKESQFQKNVIDKLKKLFPGCVVLKNDSSYAQGIPDLTVLYKDKWAMLEVKASMNSKNQPNQMYYIDYLSEMSFAALICPENEKEILDELQHAFNDSR